MGKTDHRYPPEFRQRIVELVRLEADEGNWRRDTSPVLRFHYVCSRKKAAALERYLKSHSGRVFAVKRL